MLSADDDASPLTVDVLHMKGNNIGINRLQFSENRWSAATRFERTAGIDWKIDKKS